MYALPISVPINCVNKRPLLYCIYSSVRAEVTRPCARSCTRSAWDLCFTKSQGFFFQQKGQAAVQVWTSRSSISLAALFFLTLMMCNSTGQSVTAAGARHEGARGIQREHLHPELGLPRLPWLELIRAGISTLLNSVWWFYDESLDWGWEDFKNAASFFPLLSNRLFVGARLYSKVSRQGQPALR